MKGEYAHHRFTNSQRRFSRTHADHTVPVCLVLAAGLGAHLGCCLAFGAGRLPRVSGRVGSALLGGVGIAGAGMGCQGGEYVGTVVGGGDLGGILCDIQLVLSHNFHETGILEMADRLTD